MFPRDFFLDYWNPSLRNQLFVAMPFASQFEGVWKQAMVRAATNCGLEAFRVDVRKSSDSIMVDILDAVAHSRLILVDLSSVSCRPAVGRLSHVIGPRQEPVFPNGNVMYELGIAHAARQAEEVILVRSDRSGSLLFDVSGVRVHTYPADDLDKAASVFGDLILDALRTIDLTKSLQVKRAVQSITVSEIKLIRKWHPYPFRHISNDPDDGMKGILGELSAAISNLQRLGILESRPTASPGSFCTTLSWTPFGNAVVAALGSEVFVGRPDPLASSQEVEKSVEVDDQPAESSPNGNA